MDGHQLHAEIAAGGGVGLGAELVQRGIEAGSEEVELAAGQCVERGPEQAQVFALLGVDGVVASQGSPDRCKPRAEGLER